MRTLTKVAIASVFVAGAYGVLHNARDDRWNGAASANNLGERQLIWQGAGQNDQNLKLLLAVKIFAGRGNVSDQNGRGGPEGRASSADGHGTPST